MAIEVFNRYENKYMIDNATYSILKNKLSDYMELDSFNRKNETYCITNIYYDTDDSHLIRTSLAKPKYKEKLRIRAYGVPESDSKVYIEIKKKFIGLVNKRRSTIELDKAYKFIETGVMPELQPYMNKQVLCEIKYILEQHALKPKLYLSYNRRAYFGTGQHDLRISFDTGIITRRTDLKLESGIYGESLLGEDKWLMEVKVGRSIPIWMAHLLSEYRIYPISFSKYGTEYKNLIVNQTNNEIYKFETEASDKLQRILATA